MESLAAEFEVAAAARDQPDATVEAGAVVAAGTGLWDRAGAAGIGAERWD
jgi:hypothetical protein